MRKLLLTLLSCAFYFAVSAQCSVREVPLAQRASSAELIVEGRVTARNSYWDASQSMIYTASTIEVYKIFKGSLSSTSIEILTQGGTVGMNRIVVEPSLELAVGDVGVFTCESVSRIQVAFANTSTVPQYEAYASLQGFVRYDEVEQKASDVFRTYENIETEVYDVVLSPALRSYQVVQPYDFHSAQRAIDPNQSTASITSFTPTTVTAGTGTTITITGSSFGATQGSGTVRFRNADDGGATFITPLPSQYISWSSTQIVVEVPQNAGTGVIQVVQGQTFTSSQTLTVSYAHLNVDFDPGSGTIAYGTDHINDNGSGGYTWRMNTAFDADAAAKASFLRAFDTWRCNTSVNWTIGATTSINDAVSDGTNIICFDNTAPLSAGILGVCYSYWSGCASGPTIVWYVNELDIIFDDGSNIAPLTWEYGPAAPSGSEYDFETVAVHELGHGHQLGHVISPGAIMHYAISNGTSNRSLGVDDLAGGNFVQAKSVVANVCGPGAMTNHSCAVAPVAAFSGSPTTVCEGGSVTFTDLSTNTPTSWSWTFTGGTPSSSTSQNPAITYNTAGTYAVSLTATNAAGSDVETINGYITVNVCGSPPVAAFSGSPTEVCEGASVTFTDQSTNTPTSWSWTFTGGTPSSSTSQNPVITYNTAGTYAVSLTATNAFGNDAETINGYITVFDMPSASASVTNTTCNGGSDGAIDVTVSGGTPAFSYSWNPSGQTTEDRTNVSAGTYSITVTDANGCVTLNSFVVGQPTALTATMSKTDATCANNDGTATATPSGGTGPYTYSWAPGGQTTQTATGLSAGTYTCTVTDAAGCTTNDNITVNQGSCGPTQLTPASCGITLTAFNQPFYCIAVPGATNYQYEFRQGTTVIATYTRGNYLTNCVLTNVSGPIQYAQTYTVYVRAFVNSVWSGFGAGCNITTPAFPLTQLTNGSCGITLTAMTNPVYCIAVTGAQNYQWRFMQGTTVVATYTRGNWLTDCRLSNVSGVTYGETYEVTVRAQVGGVWGTYGSACNVTTPAFPTTEVSSAYCGVTLGNIHAGLTCNPVVGATNYQWRAENAALGYSSTVNRGNNQTNWRMSWYPGIQANTTYTVTVRALVGGVWGPFGNACTVNTGANARFGDPDQPEEELVEQPVFSMNVYPNPGNGENIFIELSGVAESASDVTIELYDSYGKLVYTEARVYDNGETVMIQPGELADGFYILRVVLNDQVLSKKVIVSDK